MVIEMCWSTLPNGKLNFCRSLYFKTYIENLVYTHLIPTINSDLSFPSYQPFCNFKILILCPELFFKPRRCNVHVEPKN